MNRASSDLISANKVGLIGGLLLLVWLAFVFLPRRSVPAPPVAAMPVAESKLRAAGLDDNPHWEGLPEVFAVWDSHLEWRNDKIQFAYWDPWSRSYAYFFEAIRVNGAVRFRSIPEPEFIEDSGSSYAKIYVTEEGIWTADSDLKEVSPEHPFVFFKPTSTQWSRSRLKAPSQPSDSLGEVSKVKVDVGAPVMDVPKVERKIISPDGR